MTKRLYYAGVVLLFGACSSHDAAVDAKRAVAQANDAMPDADVCTNMGVADCVFNGLAGLPFDGTTPWTLTGTLTLSGTEQPLTETLYLSRAGCQLTITSPQSMSWVTARLFITDTNAEISEHRELPHPFSLSQGFCRALADDAIHYDQRETQTYPQIDLKIVGILSY